MIGFVTWLWPSDKANHTCDKLLYVSQGVKNSLWTSDKANHTCDKLLYVSQGVKNSFGKVTSWAQLISEFLVAHMPVNNVVSDWPCTFLRPRCSCLA